MENEQGQGFTRYMNRLRGKLRLSIQQLCEGLCSHRMACYIEQGEREPDRLLREAILERLGVGAEDYECYLGYVEYAQWKMQQNILHCITFEKMEQARQLLEVYREKDQNPSHFAYSIL